MRKMKTAGDSMKIPKGDKYWREYVEDEDGNVIKDENEHTNCLLYTGAEF